VRREPVPDDDGSVDLDGVKSSSTDGQTARAPTQTNADGVTQRVRRVSGDDECAGALGRGLDGHRSGAGRLADASLAANEPIAS
jgi:hypothetical protein